MERLEPYVFLLLALFFWTMVFVLSLALIALIGSLLSFRAGGLDRVVAMRWPSVWWFVAWCLMFVFCTVWYINAGPAREVPLGEMTLRPKLASGYDELRVIYDMHDMQWATGLIIECIVDVKRQQDGQMLSLNIGNGIHDPLTEPPIRREEIEKGLAEFGVDLTATHVQKQVDQLTQLFDNLGPWGLRSDGLSAFDYKLRPSYPADKRFHMWGILAWLWAWVLLLLGGLYANRRYRLRRYRQQTS